MPRRPDGFKARPERERVLVVEVSGGGPSRGIRRAISTCQPVTRTFSTTMRISR
jgi:hypothetical protein